MSTVYNIYWYFNFLDKIPSHDPQTFIQLQWKQWGLNILRSLLGWSHFVKFKKGTISKFDLIFVGRIMKAVIGLNLIPSKIPFDSLIYHKLFCIELELWREQEGNLTLINNFIWFKELNNKIMLCNLCWQELSHGNIQLVKKSGQAKCENWFPQLFTRSKHEDKKSHNMPGITRAAL